MATILDTFIRSIIFHRPKRATYTTSTRPDALLHIPRVNPLDYKESGTFTCGYFIAPPEPSDACHLLLYAHPNAVDIGMAYDELKEVAALAHVYVLLFEYTGYGLARDGEASEANVHIDMLSAHCFARRYLGVPADRLIVCGRSIGSAPAARLCATLPSSETPCLLILQCPFVALSDCIQQFSNNAVSIANFFGYNWFRTVDIIEHVRTPVVLHHGTRDESVPIKHAYALKKRRDEAARPCVTYLYQEEGVGHNNLSRRVLARIIREKVESTGLAPLRLPWPHRFVAHPSHFWLFFADEETNTLSAAQAVWRERHTLADLVFHREKLSLLLTLSCCVFAMHCARAWQLYQVQSRTEAFKAAVNAGLMTPYSKEDLIEHALAAWASPLGIHLAVPQAASTEVSEAVIFGARASAAAWEGDLPIPLEVCRYPCGPLLTVAELFVTPGLVDAMQQAIATAPNLLVKEDSSSSSGTEQHTPVDTSFASASTATEAGTPGSKRDATGLSRGSTSRSNSCASVGNGNGFSSECRSAVVEPLLCAASYPDMPLYLQADVVELIQTECERLVSFIADDEWDALQSLLHHFHQTSASLISEKACALCFSAATAPPRTDPDSTTNAEVLVPFADPSGSSSSSGGGWRRRAEEATLEELEEWLRPWVDRVRPPHASLVAEVPWDYYLFKGRRLICTRRGLARDTVQATTTWMQEREMVSTIYYLFCEYSHRCVKPSYIQ